MTKITIDEQDPTLYHVDLLLYIDTSPLEKFLQDLSEQKKP